MKSEFKSLFPILVGTYIVQLLAAISYDWISFNSESPKLGLTPLVALFVVLQIAGCYLTYHFTVERELRLFRRRTDLHHRVIHYARDRALHDMSPLPDLSLDPSLGEQPIAGVIHEVQEAKIGKLLDRMVRVFDLVVPRGAKVWACVRHLCHDGSYRTFIRVGDHDSDRRSTSKPLSQDALLVAKLRKLYEEEKECVIVTGQHDDLWTPMENDNLNETRSVIMGAIVAKQAREDAEGFENSSALWLLCLCSDQPDAFNEGHANLMKCCNDAVSWLLIRVRLRPECLILLGIDGCACPV